MNIVRSYRVTGSKVNARQYSAIAAPEAARWRPASPKALDDRYIAAPRALDVRCTAAQYQGYSQTLRKNFGRTMNNADHENFLQQGGGLRVERERPRTQVPVAKACSTDVKIDVEAIVQKSTSAAIAALQKTLISVLEQIAPVLGQLAQKEPQKNKKGKKTARGGKSTPSAQSEKQGADVVGSLLGTCFRVACRTCVILKTRRASVIASRTCDWR